MALTLISRCPKSIIRIEEYFAIINEKTMKRKSISQSPKTEPTYEDLVDDLKWANSLIKTLEGMNDFYMDYIKILMQQNRLDHALGSFMHPRTTPPMAEMPPEIKKAIEDKNTPQKANKAKISKHPSKPINLICTDPGAEEEGTGLEYLQRYTASGMFINGGELCYAINNWPSEGCYKKVERFYVCEDKSKKTSGG